MIRGLVLFDVDGTLVDSNYLHTIAWSRALHSAGEWAPMNAVHRLIGMGSDSLLPALIGRDDSTISDAWRAEYEKLIGEVRAFPGAADLLSQLHESGLTIGLATSAPATHLERMIDLLGVEASIDFSTHADDVARAKPDPEIFLTAMARGGGDAHTTLVVGDSTWDVVAANAARIRCIALESGGFSRAELREAGAIEVYEDVDSLRENLRTSPLAKLFE
ncbi:MAG: family hydrolase [Ilumatobacteraceae bacterium]|nr:family hydrolase [Ilumatobacteraceae bacterium]